MRSRSTAMGFYDPQNLQGDNYKEILKCFAYKEKSYCGRSRAHLAVSTERSKQARASVLFRAFRGGNFPPNNNKVCLFLDVFHIFSPHKSNFPPKTTFLEKNPGRNTVALHAVLQPHLQHTAVDIVHCCRFDQGSKRCGVQLVKLPIF